MASNNPRLKLIGANHDSLAPRIPLTAFPFEGQQTRPSRVLDTPSHPGYGLDPDGILAAYRHAEDGWPLAQCDLFEDLIENDGHLRSHYEGRINPIVGSDIGVMPGGDAAIDIEAADALRVALDGDQELDATVHHMATAPHYAYAATEVIWEFSAVDGLWVPVDFKNVPHRRFIIDDANNLRVLTREFSLDGEELLPGKWIVNRARGSSLARRGTMRTAGWWALFKRMAVKDWMVLMERFGIPPSIGKYTDETSARAKGVLENAMKRLGEGGSIIIHEDTAIEIKADMAKGGDANLHPAVVNLANMEIAKLFTGGTLVSDTGSTGSGSWALGKVHETRSFALNVLDAATIQRTLRRHLSRAFCQYNGFARAMAPRFKIQLSRDLDPMTRVMLAKELWAMGMELDAEQLYEELGFRRPSSPDRSVKMPEPEPPMKEGAE